MYSIFKFFAYFLTFLIVSMYMGAALLALTTLGGLVYSHIYNYFCYPMGC